MSKNRTFFFKMLSFLQIFIVGTLRGSNHNYKYNKENKPQSFHFG